MPDTWLLVIYVDGQRTTVVVLQHIMFVGRGKHSKGRAADMHICVIQRHVHHARLVLLDKWGELCGMRGTKHAVDAPQRTRTHRCIGIGQRCTQVLVVERLHVLRRVHNQPLAELLHAVEADGRIKVARARAKYLCHEVVEVRIERIALRVKLLHLVGGVCKSRAIRDRAAARTTRLGVALLDSHIVALTHLLKLGGQRSDRPQGHDAGRMTKSTDGRDRQPYEP